MAEPMNGLRNAKILEIQKTHDYWFITTDKGGLSIYNPVKYRTENGVFLDLEHLRLDDIVNCVVTNIIILDGNELCIKLDNGSSIAISLVEDDYYGPEAFCLDLDTGETIVG